MGIINHSRFSPNERFHLTRPLNYHKLKVLTPCESIRSMARTVCTFKCKQKLRRNVYCCFSLYLKLQTGSVLTFLAQTRYSALFLHFPLFCISRRKRGPMQVDVKNSTLKRRVSEKAFKFLLM